MDPSQFGDLPRFISRERLAPYVAAVGGDSPQALRLYTWNIEVSAAFWGPVHTLEITVRNALHDQLRGHFLRDDWWRHPHLSLTATMRAQVQAAGREARRTAARRGRAMVAADTVAHLSFGFWTGLLGPGGQSRYETRLWQPFLHRAFPNYQGPRLKPLQHEVNSLRLFRNRLAHHEPVVHRNLYADHESILRVADYLSADVAAYIDSHSRVPEALSRRDRCMKGYATSF